MLATVAIVVPSLNVLLIVTELPTLTGMLRIVPSMVERTRVVELPAMELLTPSFTILSASLALASSSRCCRRASCTFSNSSADTNF